MSCQLLAEFLTDRKDHILSEWSAAVTADPAQPAHRLRLSGSALVDHLPSLLAMLSLRLCNEETPQVECEGAAHGRQRRSLGYTAGEVIDEIAVFRRHVVGQVDDFINANPGLSRDALDSSRLRIDLLIDRSIKASIEQYISETEAERDAAAQHLEQRNRELDEANVQKERFLTMLSHELRNPLSPILSAAHVLQRLGTLSDTAVSQCRIIERQARHMTRLVDDLLDVNRLSRGKIDLRPRLMDAREAVRFALESCRQEIAAKGVRLEEKMPDEPVQVFADPTRLTQVASNLIVNARKFTEPGGTIRVVLRKEGFEALLIVEDTGVGIAPEMLPRVFDLFSQADTSLHRHSGGLGVGLMIAKTLVEMQGGRIEAASDGDGRGATFSVHLPLTLGRDRPAPPSEVAPPIARVARRVLLVEDNDDSREALGTALVLLGHEVTFAASGPDAIERAAAEHPDALVVDIGLPGMDGYQVARAIRQMPQLQRARMIALSGYGSTSDKERALEAGFDCHATKPTDVVRIHRLLSGEDG